MSSATARASTRSARECMANQTGNTCCLLWVHSDYTVSLRGPGQHIKHIHSCQEASGASGGGTLCITCITNDIHWCTNHNRNTRMRFTASQVAMVWVVVGTPVSTYLYLDTLDPVHPQCSARGRGEGKQCKLMNTNKSLVNSIHGLWSWPTPKGCFIQAQGSSQPC